MAAIRMSTRLLSSRMVNSMRTRGYAEGMNLTFAAGNQVNTLLFNYEHKRIMSIFVCPTGILRWYRNQAGGRAVVFRQLRYLAKTRTHTSHFEAGCSHGFRK